VVIFVKGSQYKLLINGHVYDAVPFGQIPGTGYGGVPSGPPSLTAATVHRETREEKADREFNEVSRRRKPSILILVQLSTGCAPTPAMQAEIFKSSVGLELAYWLATHAEQYKAIALLPMDSAIRELRKIEMTLR